MLWKTQKKPKQRESIDNEESAEEDEEDTSRSRNVKVESGQQPPRASTK